MADETPKDKTPEITPPAPTEGGDAELKLDDVVAVEPDKLTDAQKTFLEEKKGDLTDEQREKFGIKPEEEGELDLEKLKVETRTVGDKKKKKPKTEAELEEEIAPEDRQAIQKVVSEELAPLRKEAQALKDEIEVDSFIRDYPEYKRYRGAALKYISHPAYRNIPVQNVMFMISAKDQQKLGAQKERQTQEKVKQTQTPGTQVRVPVGGKIDWSTATPEQVEAHKAKVFGQTR